MVVSAEYFAPDVQGFESHRVRYGSHGVSLEPKYRFLKAKEYWDQVY